MNSITLQSQQDDITISSFRYFVSPIYSTDNESTLSHYSIFFTEHTGDTGTCKAESRKFNVIQFSVHCAPNSISITCKENSDLRSYHKIYFL